VAIIDKDSLYFSKYANTVCMYVCVYDNKTYPNMDGDNILTLELLQESKYTFYKKMKTNTERFQNFSTG